MQGRFVLMDALCFSCMSERTFTTSVKTHQTIIMAFTFPIQLTLSIIQNLGVKIYVVKKFKRHKIKNHSDMFRILCDPSSGRSELCLTGITGSGSQIFCRVLRRCLCVCVYGMAGWPAGRIVHTHTHTTGSKLRCQTLTKHMTKYLWTTTSNSSQAQLCTPWWWIT